MPADREAQAGGQESSGTDGNHVDVGTPIKYRFSPPAFGQHWPNYLPGAELRSFYTTDDRPEVERLVHSLEHGYTILWYDETIADDDEALADVAGDREEVPGPERRSTSTSSPRPGRPTTATPSPTARTSRSPTGRSAARAATPKDQVGVWEYCGGVSGAVVEQFRKDYPPLDAPEAGAS